MADDRLVIEGIFDPAGIDRGLKEAEAKLQQFAKNSQQSVSFKSIGGDVDLATADFKSGKIALDDYNQALATAKQQFQQLRQQGLEPSRSSLLQIDTALGRSTSRAGNLGTGLARVRSGLAQVAVQSVGTSNSLGQVAQGLLLLGSGTTAVIVLAAAVGVGAKAWELFTEEQHKAARAADDLAKALHASRVADVTPREQLFRQVAAAIGLQARAQLELNKIQAEENQLLKDPMFSLANQYRLRKLNAEMAQRQLDIDRGQAGLARGGGAGVISDLGLELSTLQTDTIAAADARRRLAIATTSMGEAERAAATTLADSITKLERHKQAEEEATKAAKDHADFLKKQKADYEEVSTEVLKMSKALEKDLKKALQDVADAAEDFAKATRDAIDSLPTVEDIHLDFLQKQRQAFLDIADASAGLVNTANSVGLIGDNLADAAIAGINLADALNQIDLKGATTANVLGLLGAGIGVLGSLGKLFGGEAIAREHAEIVKRNTERLAELRISLDSALQGLRGAETALRILDVSNIFQAGKVPGKGGTTFDPSAELRAALDAAGLSLIEFAAIVRQQTGIEILDREGHLAAGAWEQARKAVEQHAEALRKAAAEEADRRALEKLNAAADALEEAALLALQAARTAMEQIQSAFPGLVDLHDQLSGVGENINSEISKAMAALVAGLPTGVVPDALLGLFDINFNDAEAREALRKKMLALVDTLLSGQGAALGITPEMLGPILAFLGVGADIIDQFNEATKEATKSLLNVPHGINLMALEFQAQAAGGPSRGIPTTQPVLFGEPTRRGTDGASLPMQQVVHVTVGDVIVQALPGQNAAEIARNVKLELQRVSMSRFGTPDRWAQ